MSYQSPISIIYQDMMHKLNESIEQNVFAGIQRYGIEVDKDELIKALQYDRRQYDAGFADGINFRKHGHWIYHDPTDENIYACECSACGECVCADFEEDADYCMHCGARMDEEPQ